MPGLRMTCWTAVAALVAVGPVRADGTTAPPAISVEALLLDHRLDLERVSLVAVEEDHLRHVDARGRVRTHPISELVAVLPTSWPPADRSLSRPDDADTDESLKEILHDDRPPISWVELIDGQRFAGIPATGGVEDAGSLVWDHALFGRLRLPLEQVRWMVLDDPMLHEPRPDGPDDVVRLRNGDRVAGYVARVHPAVVVETERGEVRVDMEQVARLDLGNDPVPPTGMFVWLADGSVVAAERLLSEEDPSRLHVSLRVFDGTPSPDHRGIELADLKAIVFDASRVTSLAGLQLHHQEAVGRRRLMTGVRAEPIDTMELGASDVTLPGPLLAEWWLPSDASRIAGWATLRPESRLWGDCVVRIEVEDDAGGVQTLAEHRVRGDRPTAPFNAPLESGRTPRLLRVVLDPGAFGAVQDRVVLERVLILRGHDR